MKTVLKKMYYCDHCKKRGMSSYHMQRHESGCTANPDRACKMCGAVVGLRAVVEDFKARFLLKENKAVEQPDGFWQEPSTSHAVIWTAEPVLFSEVISAGRDCPCCILAILRQTGMNRHYFSFDFDFKKGCEDWWVNHPRDESHYY